MLKQGLLIILLSSLLVSCSSPLPEQSPQWSTTTQQALQQMYRALQVDSAGGHDIHNPYFTQWLKVGYQKAKVMAQHVDSVAGYYFTLKYYAAGFHDGHVRLTYNGLLAVNWPGFTTRYQQGHFYVDAIGKTVNNIPVNAELVACNGSGIKSLFRKTVLLFNDNPDLIAAWSNQAWLLMFDFANPFSQRLQVCQFRYAGKTFTHPLIWQHLTPDQFKQLQNNFTTKPTLGKQVFGKHGIWISIPTLDPQTAADRQALQQLVLQAKMLRQYNPIVFDVRGNGGGNSWWALQLLTHLYGQPLMQWVVRKHDHQFELWRASQANIDVIHDSYLPKAQQNFGEQSVDYRQMQAVYHGMQQALTEDEPFYKLGDPLMRATLLGPEPKNPVHSQVYFLTDGHCASSCMDFADYMHWLPGITMIGQTTYADTFYTETRFITLEGSATLMFPMKIHVGRERGYNQPYQPRYIYQRDMRDTVALQKWVMALAHQAS